jgi:hypothetical protein
MSTSLDKLFELYGPLVQDAGPRTPSLRISAELRSPDVEGTMSYGYLVDVLIGETLVIQGKGETIEAAGADCMRRISEATKDRSGRKARR